MNQDGKTLMEMLIVVAMIGVLAGIAVPNFLRLRSHVQISAATAEIASELRLARQLAIASRERVRLLFDAQRHVIATEFVTRGTTHHVYRYGDKSLEVEEPSGGPEIVFYPSGRLATPTTIRLRNAVGQAEELTVSLTGRVSVL
jgi:type IV fimbrial biogenesis protein FimT